MSYWRIEGFFTACAVILFLLPAPALAQETMTEVQSFDFGLFSLRDNNAQHTLDVDASDNSYAADPAFAVATPPQRGEYLLEGFVPGTEIFVAVADGGLTLNGGGGTEVFATINYTVSPAPIIAGAGGDVTVYVGATLRTRGDTIAYGSGDYEDDLDITFSW